MTQSLVSYETDDGIARLTLNRPEKLNAINDQMIRDLAAAFERLDQDDDAFVAVLSGAGRAFSSGADVVAAQRRTDNASGMWSSTLRPRDVFYKSINWKPVISAAHGYALGAGLGLALRTDLMIVTRSIKLQITETARGVPAGGLWALLRFRGANALADELVLTGRMFSGEEAQRGGMVTAATDDDDLLDTALGFAQQIRQMPPGSVRSAIRARRWYMEEAERQAGFLAEPRPIMGMARTQTDAFTRADQLTPPKGSPK